MKTLKNLVYAVAGTFLLITFMMALGNLVTNAFAHPGLEGDASGGIRLNKQQAQAIAAFIKSQEAQIADLKKELDDDEACVRKAVKDQTLVLPCFETETNRYTGKPLHEDER